MQYMMNMQLMRVLHILHMIIYSFMGKHDCLVPQMPYLAACFNILKHARTNKITFKGPGSASTL
jgi:hypothetical protein